MCEVIRVGGVEHDELCFAWGEMTCLVLHLSGAMQWETMCMVQRDLITVVHVLMRSKRPLSERFDEVLPDLKAAEAFGDTTLRAQYDWLISCS